MYYRVGPKCEIKRACDVVGMPCTKGTCPVGGSAQILGIWISLSVYTCTYKYTLCIHVHVRGDSLVYTHFAAAIKNHNIHLWCSVNIIDVHVQCT